MVRSHQPVHAGGSECVHSPAGPITGRTGAASTPGRGNNGSGGVRPSMGRPTRGMSVGLKCAEIGDVGGSTAAVHRWRLEGAPVPPGHAMAREHAADLDDQSSPRSGAFGPKRLVTCGRLLGNTSGHEARHQGRNEHRPPSSPVGLSNGSAIGCGRTAPGERPGRGRPCVHHADGTARATSPRVGINGFSVGRAVAGLAQKSVRTRHRHHRWGTAERPPSAGDGGQQDLRGR